VDQASASNTFFDETRFFFKFLDLHVITTTVRFASWYSIEILLLRFPMHNINLDPSLTQQSDIRYIGMIVPYCEWSMLLWFTHLCFD